MARAAEGWPSEHDDTASTAAAPAAAQSFLMRINLA